MVGLSDTGCNWVFLVSGGSCYGIGEMRLFKWIGICGGWFIALGFFVFGFLMFAIFGS